MVYTYSQIVCLRKVLDVSVLSAHLLSKLYCKNNYQISMKLTGAVFKRSVFSCFHITLNLVEETNLTSLTMVPNLVRNLCSHGIFLKTCAVVGDLNVKRIDIEQVHCQGFTFRHVHWMRTASNFVNNNIFQHLKCYAAKIM